MVGVRADTDRAPVLETLDALARVSELPLKRYRTAHVQRCIERALTRTGTPDARALAARLRRDASARASFRRSVLVPITRMFRDPDQFRMIETTVVPELVRQGRPPRVWSAGCAAGDELLSIAILLDRAGALAGARLIGSDLSDESIQAARARTDFPTAAGTTIRFVQLDLLADPAPAGQFDLVLCRNVAIYLNQAAQRELHAALTAALASGGHLVLGASEMLPEPERLGLVAVARHLYRRGRP